MAHYASPANLKRSIKLDWDLLMRSNAQMVQKYIQKHDPYHRAGDRRYANQGTLVVPFCAVFTLDAFPSSRGAADETVTTLVLCLVTSIA